MPLSNADWDRLDKRFDAQSEHIRDLFGKRIDDLEHKVNGNSNSGLMKDVDRLKEQAKREERSQGRRIGFWLAAAIAGVGGLINLAMALLK